MLMSCFGGSERVSIGTEEGFGFMMKQSSGSGSERVRVKGVLGVDGTVGKGIIRPVGMPSGVISRCRLVPRVTMVSATVVEGRLRLK